MNRRHSRWQAASTVRKSRSHKDLRARAQALVPMLVPEVPFHPVAIICNHSLMQFGASRSMTVQSSSQYSWTRCDRRRPAKKRVDNRKSDLACGPNASTLCPRSRYACCVGPDVMSFASFSGLSGLPKRFHRDSVWPFAPYATFGCRNQFCRDNRPVRRSVRQRDDSWRWKQEKN